MAGKPCEEDNIRSVIVDPMIKLSLEMGEKGKKCWLPWNRAWYYGFSLGLCAAIDLVERVISVRDEEES